MRTTLLFASAIALLISSCSTGNKMESSANKGDDLYATETETAAPSLPETYSDNQEYQNDQSDPSPDYSTSDKYTDEEGTTYITNNYYEGQNYDFYGSDYSYSSDLSRWYGPSLGFGYYSPFYTSFGFGVSLSFGFGWGTGWYNPYYSWYSPYYSYNPWYSPYYYGYNPYYYPYYGCGYYGGGYYGGGYCGGGYYGGGYYGDGYGYGGNTYYGSHGSSSSNTSGNGDGRKYKYGDEANGDQGSGVNSTNNVPVLAETPRTSIGINGNATNGADITSPVVDSEHEIKRKPAVQNNNSSNSEVETINSNPGRNLSTPDNSSEIKSNVPPVRSASPSNQNTQNNRPRTIAQAPLFEQQRNTNSVANAVNKQMSSGNPEYAQAAPKARITQDMSGVKNEKAVVMIPSRSNPAYKISKPQPEKHPAFSKEQLEKSKQSKSNANIDRPSNNGNNAATRSYNQSNNAHSSPSGNTRSSNSNNSRRK